MPAFLLLLLLLLPTACSVLEDRDGCPCRLHIDLSGVSCPEVCLLLTRPGGSWRDLRTLTLPGAEDVLVNVPRGKVDVMAVWPRPSGDFSGDGWEIPAGEDCPPVYLDAHRVDTDREEAFCSLRLHKHFCRLTLRLASDGGGEPFPFRLTVEGNVSGFSPRGAPREGSFSYRLPPFDAAGETTVCLPRQKDASLTMEVLFTDEVLRHFALGELMARGGYDWSAPDLADATLTLDYARTRLTLRAGAWEETVFFEKVL